MKYKYEFNGESVEIEIDDKWNEVLVELDRIERNNDHKETRRHYRLDVSKSDSECLIDPNAFIEEILINKETTKEIVDYAKAHLKPRQFEVFQNICVCEMSGVECAKKMGLTPSAIYQILRMIRNKMSVIF